MIEIIVSTCEYKNKITVWVGRFIFEKTVFKNENNFKYNSFCVFSFLCNSIYVAIVTLLFITISEYSNLARLLGILIDPSMEA